MIRNRFRVAPRPFNAVKLFSCLSSNHKSLGKVYRMMLAMLVQRLLATKRVDGIDGPLPGIGFDMPYKFLKGATKHKRATPPRVGRTTKNPTSCSIHAPVFADAGYDTPYIPISKGLETL